MHNSENVQTVAIITIILDRACFQHMRAYLSCLSRRKKISEPICKY